jgi:hypothetical protein
VSPQASDNRSVPAGGIYSDRVVDDFGSRRLGADGAGGWDVWRLDG